MKECVFQQRQVVSRLAVVALVCLAAGCASPRLTTTWTDPSYSGPPFASILVVANPEDGGARLAVDAILTVRLQIGARVERSPERVTVVQVAV